MTDEEYKIHRKKLTPTNNIKILVWRKRRDLNLPTGKIKSSGGGRDYRRELVRMRDDHTCQICKKKWKQGERAFDIHHKDMDKDKTRNMDSFKDFVNLITLCHKCHLQLHWGLTKLDK